MRELDRLLGHHMAHKSLMGLLLSPFTSSRIICLQSDPLPSALRFQPSAFGHHPQPSALILRLSAFGHQPPAFFLFCASNDIELGASNDIELGVLDDGELANLLTDSNDEQNE
ncbi:unnamed protein product [Prunus armeniaca]